MPVPKQAAHRQSPMTGRSRSARLALERLARYAYEEEYLGTDGLSNIRDHVPEAWDHLEKDVDVWEPKEKVTLYLDKSVAKFFRAMGTGYQGRINRVLMAYAQMKIADLNLSDRAFEEYRAKRRDALLREKQGRTDYDL